MKRNKYYLRDVLQMTSDKILPDEWKFLGYFGGDNLTNTCKIELCFGCEEETHIFAYPEHPIFLPLYDCQIINIEGDVDDDGNSVIRVWLDWNNYTKEKKDIFSSYLIYGQNLNTEQQKKPSYEEQIEQLEKERIARANKSTGFGEYAKTIDQIERMEKLNREAESNDCEADPEIDPFGIAEGAKVIHAIAKENRE